MTISVIVPFLNEEKYLDTCIKSLLHQKYPSSEYELIFIDNGSSDNSARIVKQYPSVTYIREPIKNVYKARNRALRKAKGKILAFTDADCRVSENWLKEINQSFKDSDVYAVLGKRIFPKNVPEYLKVLQEYDNEKADYTINNLEKNYYFAYTNNFAMRKLVLKKTGDFSLESVSGDTQMVQKLFESFPQKKYRYNNKMVITHLEIDNTLTYLSKLKDYGDAVPILEKASNYTTLDTKTNMEIYKRTLNKHRFSKLSIVKASIIMFAGKLLFSRKI